MKTIEERVRVLLPSIKIEGEMPLGFVAMMECVLAAVAEERAACEQAIRDSGIKYVDGKPCAFATIEASIEAIKARGPK